MRKNCWQITIATLMQPLQYDSRCSAAKDHSVPHAAAATRNLDAAIALRSAETELQTTIELRATAPGSEAPNPDRGTILKDCLYKRNLERKLISVKILRCDLHRQVASPNVSTKVAAEAGARHMVFSRVKWLDAAMQGSSSVRRLRLRSFAPVIGFSIAMCRCRSPWSGCTMLPWWQTRI